MPINKTLVLCDTGYGNNILCMHKKKIKKKKSQMRQLVIYKTRKIFQINESRSLTNLNTVRDIFEISSKDLEKKHEITISVETSEKLKVEAL